MRTEGRKQKTKEIRGVEMGMHVDMVCWLN
jgi:hypothetical protein